MNELSNNQIMSEMAKIAIEQATEMFAQKALEMSREVPDDMTGSDALVAFAMAIQNTNSRVFGKGEGR